MFLLAKSSFQFSAFLLVIFGMLFSIIHISVYKFCAKNFALLPCNLSAETNVSSNSDLPP